MVIICEFCLKNNYTFLEKRESESSQVLRVHLGQISIINGKCGSMFLADYIFQKNSHRKKTKTKADFAFLSVTLISYEKHLNQLEISVYVPVFLKNIQERRQIYLCSVVLESARKWHSVNQHCMYYRTS